MKTHLCIVLLLALCRSTLINADGETEDWTVADVSTGFENFQESISVFGDKLDKLAYTVRDLARQVMLQQFFVEERSRTEGNSGIKLMRHDGDGPYTYYMASHNGKTVLGAHDHASNVYTVGLGELHVVLNGVEFRTRHNDYLLKQPSTTSNEFGLTEDVVFPQVPPEVLQYDSLEDQVMEMREWFRAFKEQNKTHRNYPEYFTPVFCYMEGAWTLDENITEPFFSDRHFVDASSWHDLMEKIRFNSVSGGKDHLENLAYLPTTIVDVDEDTGDVAYAQWNYRIVCKNINVDIPFEYFRPLDDMGNRLARKRSWDAHLNSKGARFALYEFARDQYVSDSLLDQIFNTIPGKTNVPDPDHVTIEGDNTVLDPREDGIVPLNTFFYHRKYKFEKAGAMGTKVVNRGFNDGHLWVANTDQGNIAPFRRKICTRERVEWKPNRYRWEDVCTFTNHRYSYAIPLEIIYLTPLWRWNPHNIQFYDSYWDIFGPNRELNGSAAAPLLGSADTSFYQTPLSFLSDEKSTDGTLADTSKYSIHVLDGDGKPVVVTPSGQRIFSEIIDGGVGRIRLRWPIAPIHAEGSTAMKEVTALRQMVVDEGTTDGYTNNYRFQLATGYTGDGFEHTHEFNIHKEGLVTMAKGQAVILETELSAGHTHEIRVKWDAAEDRFYYNRCDDRSTCFDDHPHTIQPLEDVSIIHDLVP